MNIEELEKKIKIIQGKFAIEQFDEVINYIKFLKENPS